MIYKNDNPLYFIMQSIKSVPPNTCYKTALNGKGITNMCPCKNMKRKFWNLFVLLTFTGLPPTLWPTGTRHLIVLLPHCHHKPVLFWYSVIVFSSIFHDCMAQYLQKLQNLLLKVITHYNTPYSLTLLRTKTSCISRFFEWPVKILSLNISNIIVHTVEDPLFEHLYVTSI